MRSDKVMTVMTLFSLRFARFIMYRVEIRLRKLMEMEFNHWKKVQFEFDWKYEDFVY